MSALRKGEWAALLGAAALLVLLFLPWFDGRIGWTSAGWFLLLLLILAMTGAVAIAATTVEGLLVRVMPALVFGSTAAFVAAVALTLRVVAFAPGDRSADAWLACLAAWAIFGGAGYALADERTDSPQSAYTPPAPRPAPPAT